MRASRLSPRRLKSEYLVLVIFFADSFANPILPISDLSRLKASVVLESNCDLLRFRQIEAPSRSSTCLNGIAKAKPGSVSLESRSHAATTTVKWVSLRLRGGGSGKILIKTLTGESFRYLVCATLL